MNFDLNYSIAIYDNYNTNCPLFIELVMLKIGGI